MALTDSEKSLIRRYLGYPEVTPVTIIQSGTARFAQTAFVLEQNMLNLTPSGEMQVRAILAQLATSRTEIDASLGRLKAAKVGSITLNAAEMKQRKTHDRWLVCQLAAVLSVKPLDDDTPAVRIR
jgi:hypothetical protein